MVDQTRASWNRVTSWLQRLERLRRAAWPQKREGGDAELDFSPAGYVARAPPRFRGTARRIARPHARERL